jgi:hypothetical protein
MRRGTTNPEEGMDGLAGRLPAETDIRTIQMSRYANLLEVPDGDGEDPPQAPLYYGLRPDGQLRTSDRSVTLPSAPPLGPEAYQSCVPAAMADLAQAWNAIEGKEAPAPTLDKVLHIYERVSPFRIDPVPPPPWAAPVIGPNSQRREEHNDFGTSLLGALRTWVKPDGPLRDLLPAADGFLEIEPQNTQQMREAIWRFGGLIAGIALPQFVIKPDVDELEDTWYVPGYGPIGDATPGSFTSHCVAIIGYTPQYFLCRVNGVVTRISNLFAGRSGYFEECYTLLRPHNLDRYPRLRSDFEKDLAKRQTDRKPRDLTAFPHHWLGSHIM